jgi:hypothetical protein
MQSHQPLFIYIRRVSCYLTPHLILYIARSNKFLFLVPPASQLERGGNPGGLRPLELDRRALERAVSERASPLDMWPAREYLS